MLTIFKEISAERDYQDELWGHKFDDNNTLNDWVTYITLYSAQAASMKNVGDPAEQRRMLLKAASLAVAAIEAFDRNGGFPRRHYEPEVVS